MDGGAFEPRSAAIGAGYQENTARAGYSAACLHPNLDQRAGQYSVWLPYGDDVAGSARRDGRDAGYNRTLWNGRVLGQQATAGAGNSYGLGRAPQGNTSGSAGTCLKIAGFWFGCRTAPGNPGEPGARFYRVSGNSSRSAGTGRRGSGYEPAWTAGYVDSSATRAIS